MFAASAAPVTSVRITSGKFRGRRLAVPRTGTHPMGDREKLALFNTLGPLSGAERVLDCYCGSGALGLEALSRGTLAAVFVDRDVAAVSDNIRALGVEDQAEIIKLKITASTTDKIPGVFDLIFIDPPYDAFSAADFASLASHLAAHGQLVLSHPETIDPKLLFKGLIYQKTKKFARCHLSFYKKV